MDNEAVAVEQEKQWSIETEQKPGAAWNVATVSNWDNVQLQHEAEIGTVSTAAYVFSQGNQETKQGGRDAHGRWLPGTVTGGHRPSNKTIKTIKQVIRDRYTLEQLLGRLDEAYNIALMQKSPRGMINATIPILEYSEGKPVQQVVIEAGRTDLLEQLLQSDRPLLPEPEPVLQIETKDNVI